MCHTRGSAPGEAVGVREKGGDHVGVLSAKSRLP